MTYKECTDKLGDYFGFWNKTVESEGELYKVIHTLICPVNQPQFSIYINDYLVNKKSAEMSLTPFVNDDLQIVLKAYKLSDDSVALLEISEVKLISKS